MGSLLAKYMPINGSAHGAELDQLSAMLHWLMALLFVGWGIFFIYVLFRFRAGRNPQASYTGTKTKLSSYAEVAVAAIEVVLLVGFAIPAWARWVAPAEPGSDQVEVRVVAEQFAWNIHYPGPDGVFGKTAPELIDTQTNPLGLDSSDPYAQDDITTINQLHLPVDREVTIYLSSKDVIHSFFLPTMRVKQDAIPGMEIPVRFKPIVASPPEADFPACAGTKTCWEIACAQLCGLSHYSMKGYFTVHEAGGFEAWLAEQSAS
jgi:cytochrome c oxidase subunit 2